MENFKKQKEEIIKRAKAADACKGQFQRAVAAENITDLITVLKDNLRWCVVNGMLDAQALEDIFGLELLKENHIYIQGVNEVRVTEGNAYIVTLDSSSANVETWGSSPANVETWDSRSKLETKVEGSNSFIRNHNTRTISVKKDNFTIEIIE